MKFMYCDRAVYFILLFKLQMFGATIGRRVAPICCGAGAQLTFALGIHFTLKIMDWLTLCTKCLTCLFSIIWPSLFLQ